MKRYLILAAISALTLPALAQSAQVCICTAPAGCTIASDPFPALPTEQPTMCTLKAANGSTIAQNAPVDSATIPLSNATRCSPASPAYNPGPAGSKACSVFAGNTYAVGNTLTFTMTATYASSGETGVSAPLAFTNVVSLPINTPSKPLNLREARWGTPDGELLHDMRLAWME
jgi:hypothetical protein